MDELEYDGDSRISAGGINKDGFAKPPSVSAAKSVKEEPNITNRSQIPSEVWENMKPIIKHLYLDEDHTLRHVIQAMRDSHQFHAT